MQEAGASPLATFALHRYTLIPAIAWALIFIRPDDLAKILHTPHQVLYFVIIFLIWNGQQLIHSYTINTASTVSVISNLHNLMVLPLLLLVGAFFNNDHPNLFSVAAIAALVFALIIKPAHHVNNQRTRFSKPFLLIAGFILMQSLVDAVLIGLCRQLLKEVPPKIFIGVFDILVLAACVLCVSFLAGRQPMNLRATVKKHPVRAVSIPVIFFIGSVVEFYAQAALPIYIMVSIGAVTFIMDIFSDLWRHRISFNFQTASFILLVLLGISLSVYSI